VTQCASCGKELPGEFRFCPFCAAPLERAAASSAREERKVVSVLFCDLVGFTARSEKADPEDVRARLRPYHERAKQELERFGGTVEKFAGDAVMAVFGAPVVREDDAERAVLAGLAVLAAIEEMNVGQPGLDLTMRAAVNTGEAVVALDARPELGEAFVAGDVVNTAARLQQAAPPGSLVVGAATFGLTRDGVEYEPLPDMQAKGKKDLLRLWRARRFVGRTAGVATPFVGRADELALLERTLARTLGERTVQLVTVLGEPGAGKSRLLLEFRRSADARGVAAVWRRGRCLPYGEGITFWALGEVVKEACGILESDSVDEAGSKLQATVDAVVDPDRSDWVRARLGPLVGLGGAGAGGDRREVFTAWRSFVEALALRAPLVLVFEDMHWAGEPLLEFVEDVVDRLSDVPLLVVCSARPELFEERPGWGGGKRNAAAIALPPLAPEETRQLVSAILARSMLPASTQTEVAERAGGNPLFAEEFARMIENRLAGDDAAPESQIAVPDSVRALIAARLDTLPPDRKALLQDAAVLGRVFWAEGVAAMGSRDRNEVADVLHELARKEFVRQVRTSAIAGQNECTFWHVLVRDVAYAQIPRADRVSKHQAAATWIEQISADRVADHAELLAYHYREALVLAHAAGLPEQELAEGARRFLILAAERTERLDLATSESLYLEAVELLEGDDPRQTHVLSRLGWLALLQARYPEAEERFTSTIAEADAAGRAEAAVDAIAGLAYLKTQIAQQRSADELLQYWVGRLDAEEPNPDLGPLYSELARRNMVAGRAEDCSRYAERAIAAHTATGNAAAVSRALQFRAAARADHHADYEAGLADMQEAVRLGRELGLGIELAHALSNFADYVWWTAGPAAALEHYGAAIAHADQRGLLQMKAYSRGERLWVLFDLGRWDELLEEADDLIATSHALTTEGFVLPYKAGVLVRRGDTVPAGELTASYLDRLRQIGDPQSLVPGLTSAALVALATGDPARALSLVAEIDRVESGKSREWRHYCLPDTTRICIQAGDLELAHKIRRSELQRPVRQNELTRMSADAILAEASGALPDALRLYADAAARWQHFGQVPEQAHALLGHGRVSLALRQSEASESLRAAQKIFASLEYRAPLAETEALLAASGAIA
jgi:class 3 adenylate cyclase